MGEELRYVQISSKQVKDAHKWRKRATIRATIRRVMRQRLESKPF